MIEPSVLGLLRCPQDGSPLRLAEKSTVERLNAEAAAGRLVNQAGDHVEQPIDGALVRESGDLAYPIFEGIPVLLADEAISLDARAEPTGN